MNKLNIRILLDALNKNDTKTVKKIIEKEKNNDYIDILLENDDFVISNKIEKLIMTLNIDVLNYLVSKINFRLSFRRFGNNTWNFIYNNDLMKNIDKETKKEIYSEVILEYSGSWRLYTINDDYYYEILIKSAMEDTSLIPELLVNLKNISEDKVKKQLKINLENIINEDNIFSILEKNFDVYNMLSESKKRFVCDVVIKQNNAKFMYEIALRSSEKDIKILIEKIMQTNNVEYIIKTAIYVDNSLLDNMNSVSNFFISLSLLDVPDNEKQQLLRDALKNIGEKNHKNFVDDYKNQMNNMFLKSICYMNSCNNPNNSKVK